MSALLKDPESIHPALWRASQLARSYGRTVDTGYADLSDQLPSGGWPVGSLIEILLSQSGSGEMRLLRPALIAVSKRPIALIQPPQAPNAQAFAYQGIPVNRLLLLRPSKSADALWSAEQILKAGSCGALLLWQPHIRAESLRRLLLAAQSAETLFFLFRPIASAQDASPATLRLTVRPATNGVSIEVIKRKGPIRSGTLTIAVQPSPILLSPHPRRRTVVDVPFSMAMPEKGVVHATPSE